MAEPGHRDRDIAGVFGDGVTLGAVLQTGLFHHDERTERVDAGTDTLAVEVVTGGALDQLPALVMQDTEAGKDSRISGGRHGETDVQRRLKTCRRYDVKSDTSTA